MPTLSQFRTTTALVAALLATQISLARAADTTVPATATTPALPAGLAHPATSDTILPAIVVLHGCEGYRKRYGALADDFARNGFIAVAIDTLKPRG